FGQSFEYGLRGCRPSATLTDLLAMSPTLEFRDPPEAIVDADGHVALGAYRRPFRHANLEQARITLGRIPLGRVGSRLVLKEWQHVAIILPEAMLTYAIVDAKYVKTSWCHFVNRDGTGQFEHARKGLRLRVARDLWNATTQVRAHGYRIHVHNHLDVGEHTIRIHIHNDGRAPSVEAELRCMHDLERNPPLEVVMPVGPGRAMYSHKVSLPIEGTLKVGQRVIDVCADEARAIWDVHKAHYPHRTWWNWATFAGKDDQGRTVALNLTRNINRRDDEINENAVWLDGALQRLGPARFTHDPFRSLEPWKIGTADGAVDLSFRPLGERRENLRLGLIRSVFHQPFGVFSGTIHAHGQMVRIDDAWGICEDHDALW
ncbi:MAG TPA: DUF2804 domain-containing protein, partial [Polyangiaceae bacterium]|nr:DUF2804 domain-containing protein [Polyangiaceae bacterium]